MTAEEPQRSVEPSQHLVGEGVLPSVAYLPEFITQEEEARLLENVHAMKAKWTAVSGRRLQSHGGSVHPKGLIKIALPQWLQALCKKLPQSVYGGAAPNHVLVNAYAPGEGILAHEDGPAYYPGVCILSIASPAVLRFWRKREEISGARGPPDLSVLLMPRSLVVFWDEAYTHALHGIEEVHDEVIDASVVNAAMYGLAEGDVVPRGGERVSLTVRRVEKVLSNLLVGR